MSNLLGVDVSKWSGDMDWQKCYDAGARFAFARAGSISIGGELYTDYQFLRNASLAPDHFPTGFYWYFRPQHDPEKQADYFCNLIRDEDWKLAPVLDLESTGGLSPTAITQAAKVFITQVYVNLDVWPLLYSRGYWLNDNTVSDAVWDFVDLWIARYTFKGKPWGNLLPWPDNPKVKPKNFDEWLFWQWSADGNGRGAEFGAKSKSIDLDYFNGDQAAFDDYVNKPQLPPALPASGFVKVNFEIDGKDVKYQGRVNLVE